MRTLKPVSRAAIIGFVLSIAMISCDSKKSPTNGSSNPESPQYEFESTGEEFLISAIDEINAIADWSGDVQTLRKVAAGNPRDRRLRLAKVDIDTVIVYGSETPDGYGATVTERYTHPKGLLLITVRMSYGKGNGHVVTETKRYISYSDLQNDIPQQSNLTEAYGLSSDTIVAHVLRNGTLETYTFRLPVVTRTVNPQDGSVKVSSRFGLDGMVVTEVRDGNGLLSQRRKTYGESDGSLVTRTEYADSTWRQVRTLGRSDGTILREVTSSD